MMQTKAFKRNLVLCAVLGAFAPAWAQSGDGDTPTVVVLGSRAPVKSALDTAVPVGLISTRDMQSTGMLELGKVLQDLDPSVNFSTTFISDGTDIIRPATLRGLGPDQLLVLVNGKRRHQQALVNVQQTIGRGSAGTDINAIPLSAIERIEVLRDGASAQYGSDAIAGVINIVLKKGAGTGQLGATAGTTAKGDGDTYGLSAYRGFALGSGYLDLAVEGRKRGETNRAGFDTLRVNPPRVTQRIGDSLAKDAYLWLNSALPVGASGELYAFGGVSKRTGDAGGFFRPREDGRTVPEVYPNGFLPTIRTTVRDASLAFGYRHDLPRAWSFDASVNHGRNELAFHEQNSINVSYWYEPKCSCSIYGESPREADTGKLRYWQTTANLDVKGPTRLFGFDSFVALGAEYRREGYQIVAGDPVSYQYGRTNNPAIKILDQNGNMAAAGIQGFPGYTPATEVDEGRHSYALYLDIEQTFFNKTMTVGSAIRKERYSDFGNSLTGKTTIRWDPLQQLGLRASESTGFRAPGVQQKFYSSVSTNLNGAGVLTDTLTAREGSQVARAFGIAPLIQEQSKSYSLGMVLRPMRGFTLTADFYRTQIYNRIVFSSNIAPESGACLTPAACPIKSILTPLNVGQAQFFTNAIDTATRGLDIVAEHTSQVARGKLVLSGQLGLNRTEVTGRHSSSPYLTGAQLFDDAQVTLIERGQPRQHHVLAADYSTGPWNANARANYYGPVQGQGFTAPFVQTWEGKWLLDLSGRYALTKQLSLSAGANNVFDTYPTRWDTAKAASFPQLGFTYCWETCPFGINGRTMYVRADYTF
jgi:iron complex outermembrane receptor protein